MALSIIAVQPYLFNRFLWYSENLPTASVSVRGYPVNIRGHGYMLFLHNDIGPYRVSRACSRRYLRGLLRGVVPHIL